MEDFIINYEYKNVKTGELKKLTFNISEIEQGAISGFSAIAPFLNGWELVRRYID